MKSIKSKLVILLAIVFCAVQNVNSQALPDDLKELTSLKKSSQNTEYYGSIIMDQNKKWTLTLPGLTGTLNENARDQWSIYFDYINPAYDLIADLYDNKVYIDVKGQKIHVFDILSPADHSVSGFDAVRIYFGPKGEKPPTITNPTTQNGLNAHLGFSISNQNQIQDYNAGVGFYTSVWPLISKPLKHFQTGLPSIWLTPNNLNDEAKPLCPIGTTARDNWPERGPTYRDVFQTLEGGGGYWGSTHFANSTTPKFMINGIPSCYNYGVNSPGSGWEPHRGNTFLPSDKMGLAQLSNRLIIPPDHLTFEGNPNGDVLGYTWMSLPLTESTYTGEFRIKEGQNWVELDKNGVETANLKETKRDAWSIYLTNQKTFNKIRIDFYQKGIYEQLKSSSQWKIKYNIMYPFVDSKDVVNVDRAVFAASNTPAPVEGAPTGDNSWTIFMNSENFKGPLAFFVPETWSRIAVDFQDNSYDIGKGLDTKLASPSSGNASMEFNSVPYFTGKDAKGIEYVKIAPIYFPTDENNQSVLVRDLKLYSKNAIYDSIEQWRKGGVAASGSFKNKGVSPTIHANATHVTQNKKPINNLNSTVESKIFQNGKAWGFQWNNSNITPKGQFPQYYRNKGKSYTPVSWNEVPAETGLLDKAFPAENKKGQAYVAPDSGVWTNPGGQNKTYTTKLSDGSTVTYKWYRFIDQPSLQNFNFSDEKKDKLQAFVEKIHKEWTIDKEYMDPPSSGKLVSLDDALIVKPPVGLKYGYVPIVIKQEKL